MNFFCCLLLATVLLPSQLAQGQEPESAPTTTIVQCLQGASKKCTIPMVDLPAPADELLLPDLSEKTTLQIKGGNLAAFDVKLCNQLGTVKKLQLGSLGLKELCVTSDLREVSAAGNRIGKIQFTSSSSSYKLQILDLQGNGLTTLEGFDVLVSLVEVHLERNQLESFDWAVFSRMAKLERLYLNDNSLKSVIANERITLPVLEYLTLANNQLTSLDVTNWEFESLTEYDISTNNLSQVHDLINHFPSSQAVLLADNQWYCGWLQATLEHFNKTFVQVKDRDQDCEGITSANICCTPEEDVLPEDTDLQGKLDKLDKEQMALRTDLETQFSSLKSKHNNELEDLENKLMRLTVPDMGPDTSDTNNQHKPYEQKLQDMQATAEKELHQMSLQQQESENAQLRLSYTVLELRKSVEKSKKTVAELQAQFDNLRADIYQTMRKRD